MVVRDMKAVARRITRRADWLRLNHRGWRPVWAYELLAGAAFHLAGENHQAQRLFSQASQTAWPRSLDSVPVCVATRQSLQRAIDRALGESRLLHRLEGQLYVLALTTRFPALRG